MSPRDWPLLVQDMLEAIGEIRDFVADMTRDELAADARTHKAVLMNLCIIGEAARHMPDAVVDSNPQVPWRKMGDLRNVAIHGYFGIDFDIVWDVVQNHLPPIEARLQELIEEHGA